MINNEAIVYSLIGAKHTHVHTHMYKIFWLALYCLLYSKINGPPKVAGLWEFSFFLAVTILWGAGATFAKKVHVLLFRFCLLLLFIVFCIMADDFQDLQIRKKNNSE